MQFIVDSPNKFPVNGQYMYFWAMVSAIALYVIVSLLTCKKDFNMDKMLHRGEYALADDKVKTEFAKRWTWGSIIGIDRNFTTGDKAISVSVFSWTMFWWVVFVIVTIWNIFSPWPISWWGTYWHYYAIIIPLIVGVITTVWFVCGGIHDLRVLYRDLKVYKSDSHDDGTVSNKEEQVLPDNYIDFVESEEETGTDPKPYPGKPSKMD